MPPHVLRQRLSDVDAKISHHESILEAFKQQRSVILSELNLVTYPVLILPPEITVEIFKWALAFSPPALWDTISEIEFGVHPRAEAVVETWFNRAGTRPLLLTIICPERLESARLESIILQHASQLQSLNVMTNSEVLFNFTAVQSFPMLSNLTLSCLNLCDNDEGYIQLFGIYGAPALRHLSLDGVLPSMVTMPWGQLTKMTLWLLPRWECLNALRWATSLHEFRRQGPPEEGEQSTSEESSVHHPSLFPSPSPLPQKLTTFELVRSMGLPFKTDLIRALDRRTSPDFLHTEAPVLRVLGLCDATDAAHAKLESLSLIWSTFDYKPEVPVARLLLMNVVPLRALAEEGCTSTLGRATRTVFTDTVVRHILLNEIS
ncbi:hypothetical protein B0H19DRAFT_1265357 [Mycena capillaripes]|nr:hypothetical protein B0H19DRAFT_1265357 [Mycena capillaripes]